MQQSGVFGTLLPLLVFFAIFYFLIIRPQQKQAKTHKEMVNSLAKGDKILTNGGLKATVIKTTEDFITIKLNDDVIVELDKAFVARKLDA